MSSSGSSIFSQWYSYLRVPFITTSGLAAVGSSLLYFKQNDIIYPASLPAGSRTEVPRPSQYGIQDEFASSVTYPTPDGEKLHAYLIRPPNTQLKKNVTVLMFHGNAGNVGHRIPVAKVLSEALGCHVFMVEYRGYGHSTGSPDEKGLTIDAQTSLDYVRALPELRHSHIVIYGQSLGGAVAVKLTAANHQRGDIAGLILENTFTSIRKLIPSVMPPAKYIAFLCHQVWSSEDIMRTFPAKAARGPPVLFLSGLKDEIVPPAMMKTLYSLCQCKSKTWREFPAGDHNSTVAEPGYFDAIWEFLVQVVLPQERGGSGGVARGGIKSTDVAKEELWS